MFYTYIIQSKITGKYYIGYTRNLLKRIQKHNNYGNKSTKTGVPWILIYHEIYLTKEEAWKREHQIKRYKSGIAFKKLIGEVA